MKEAGATGAMFQRERGSHEGALPGAAPGSDRLMAAFNTVWLRG